MGNGISSENLLRGGLEKFYGKYRGIATDTDDPKKQGRIRAKIPKVLGDFDCNWALPCSPHSGILFIPHAGDGVWIEFEEGDPNKPIWSGVWWSQSNTPARSAYQKQHKVIYATNGDILVRSFEGDIKIDGLTINLNDGTKGVARRDDPVEVYVVGSTESSGGLSHTHTINLVVSGIVKSASSTVFSG